jgi:hypothetical protein
MRNAALLLTLLTAALAVSVSADERHQSYISYDDGGTVVRTGDREVEATRNLPIYPGDEIVTARRGRSEVHLSDGNIIGIDRATAVRFRSVLDSYEGESNETVAELKYGKVAVHRTDIGRQHVRLDTDNASYVAPHEAVYSVETDTRGRDRVIVFDGSVEVRTPSRSTRLRRGESASVDSDGVYDLVGDQRYSADDFERWFLKRAERYGTYDNRYYNDRRIGYWSDDLDTHGRWVHVSGIGWSWRPIVSVGWRPYYNGYWYTSRWGSLTWVSYDPWGWAPWHYGRWAFDPGYGWIWVPGYSYSPAWVYWMYGPGYVGWAPAGWWDCHRPYYNWAYSPYRNRHDFGFGFRGRVRVNEVDLRPWTIVDGNTLFSSRIDRAALTTDAIKQRLGRTDRSNDGFATVTGEPARFTREEYRDPAAAIRRRGLGGDTSGATGVNTDLTPFIKRDPNLGASVRDRIVRSRPEGQIASRGGVGGGNSVAPVTGGSAAPVGRGGLAPIDGGSLAPIGGANPSGVLDRNRSGAGPSSEQPRDPVRIIGRDREQEQRDTRDSGAAPSAGATWRDRVSRGNDPTPEVTAPGQLPGTAPAPAVVPRDSWRNRRSSDAGDSTPSTRSGESATRGSGDVPARVIDRIGGARVTPRNDDGNSGSSTRGGGSRDSGTIRGGGASRDSGSRGSGGSIDRGSRDSGSSSRGSSGGGSSTRSNDGGSRSSGGASSGGSSSSSSGGGSREGGGRIKRDN